MLHASLRTFLYADANQPIHMLTVEADPACWGRLRTNSPTMTPLLERARCALVGLINDSAAKSPNQLGDRVN